MPGPKLPEYPKPMYRADQDPIYANNPKHEDELIEQGWSERYVFRAYPKAMYAADGSVSIAKSQAEADVLAGKGFGVTAIPLGGHPTATEKVKEESDHFLGEEGFDNHRSRDEKPVPSKRGRPSSKPVEEVDE